MTSAVVSSGIEVTVRNATEDDLQALVEVDKEAFPADFPQEMILNSLCFKSWLKVFPGGFFVAEVHDLLVGYSMVQIRHHDIDNPIPNWYEATDNGFIAKTHDPSGNTFYGVSFCVRKGAAGLGVGTKLMHATAESVISNTHVELGVIGSRVPGFHLVLAQWSIDDYVAARRPDDDKSFDPLLRFYEHCGYRIHPKGILPDYMHDPESCDFGVLMTMSNRNFHA